MKTLAGKYKSYEVSIENLTLDIDNARWEGSASSEVDAINKISSVVGKKKMQGLINDFAERETQDLPLLIIKIQNKLIVKDGNRRLFALKFLSNLIKHHEYKMPENNITKKTKVIVHEYLNEMDLEFAINNIHGNGQAGAGLEAFSTVIKERLKKHGKSKPRLALAVADAVSKQLKEKAIKPDEIVKFTNFERMLQSSKVKKYFGIKQNKEEISYDMSKADEINTLIKETKNIKVNEIYTSEEAQEKVKEILKIKSLSPTKKDEIKVTTKVPKTKKIIIKNMLINSNLSKIKAVTYFNEFASSLRTIEYKNNMEISGPLYRVLLEYSIRYYCDQNNIMTTDKNKKGLTVDKKFFKILGLAIKHMKDNGLEKTICDRASDELNSNGYNSITFLNKVTHNYDFSLTVLDLKNIKKIFDPIILFIIGK